MMDTIDDDLNAPLGQFLVRTRPPLGKLSYTGVVFGGLGLFGDRRRFFPMFGGLAPLVPAYWDLVSSPPYGRKRKNHASRNGTARVRASSNDGLASKCDATATGCRACEQGQRAGSRCPASKPPAH